MPSAQGERKRLFLLYTIETKKQFPDNFSYKAAEAGAACDDDSFFFQKLSGLLEDYFSRRKTKISINCFANTEDFLKSPLTQYEIVFLDVELGSDSGVEAARALRRCNPDAVW